MRRIFSQQKGGISEHLFVACQLHFVVLIGASVVADFSEEHPKKNEGAPNRGAPSGRQLATRRANAD